MGSNPTQTAGISCESGLSGFFPVSEPNDDCAARRTVLRRRWLAVSRPGVGGQGHWKLGIIVTSRFLSRPLS